MSDYKNKINQYKTEIEKYLIKSLPDKNCMQKNVIEAMEYSLMAGGKRIRAALVFFFCEAFGINYKKAMPFAAAIEMIHAYSLIHDDLPCMDDDDMRRGKPSNHIVYGETIALLAGDGLLNLAFETALAPNICDNDNGCDFEISSETLTKALVILSNYSGVNGMIGGQVIDLESESKKIDEKTLKKIHSLKTSALIKASCQIGCLIGLDNDKNKEKCDKYLKLAEIYGENIGLVFQIVDDILDVTSNEEKLGKPIKSDISSEKTTYVTIFGVDGAKKIANDLNEQAKKSLDEFMLNDNTLYEIADSLLKRDK